MTDNLTHFTKDHEDIYCSVFTLIDIPAPSIISDLLALSLSNTLPTNRMMIKDISDD